MSTTNTSANQKDRGFGDTLARIFTATGVKAVVEAVAKTTGTDCGCSQRQETLNELLPYKKD